MSRIEQYFSQLRGYTSYEDCADFMYNAIDVIASPYNTFSAQEWNFTVNFLAGEMQKLLQLIPKETVYKQRYEMLRYGNELFCAYTAAENRKISIAPDLAEKAKQFGEFIETNFAFELFMAYTLESNPVKKEPLDKIIEAVKQSGNEFVHALLYTTLSKNKDNFKNYTIEARKSLTEFLEQDLERLLTVTNDQDALSALEYGSDICYYFMNDKIAALLQRIADLPINSVRAFAVETLIKYKKPVKQEIINELARDLFYAEELYSTLKQEDKLNLFPQELNNPEYLAKCDLVHWLTHPNELGEQPKEIEFFGKVETKEENYYVFKYKSDSKNLPENLRNTELVGWSGDEGGTFSEFKQFSDYDKGKPEKTLKFIKKKIFG